MGLCYSCCNPGKNSVGSVSEKDSLTPDIETKRRQQAEAAERRLREQECRGIKDPQKVRDKQRRLEELERRQDEADRQGGQGQNLKWTVG